MTTTTAERAPSPLGILDSTSQELVAHPDIWGFGGMHGGLLLAKLVHTAAGTGVGVSRHLRTVTGQFLRSARGTLSIRTRSSWQGRTTQTITMTAGDERGDVALATAVFGEARGPLPSREPTIPSVPSPSDCPRYPSPVEIVPITRFLEIRPATENLPFTAGAEAELTAWIRLVEDDHAPDSVRLVMLMDALAPSVTATMSDLRAVPTVELTVRPSGAQSSSPWVLVRGVTSSVMTEGWVDEHLQVWAEDGPYLGGGHQLRTVGAPLSNRL